MIGRLLIEKGVYEFAEAAEIVKKQFPLAQFWIVGKWDQKDRRAVDKENLDRWQSDKILTYKGTTDDIKSIIKQADVVVLPSYREGAPRTLIEAGAMSRALIATNVPGCRHVVKENYNGLLCDVRSGRSLADVILRYLSTDENEKLRLANNSRSYIEEVYDEQNILNAYSCVISRLTNTK